MTKRSNNRPLQALISLVRSDEEPLRQHRAMRVTALVAAALFMENLDSTIIVTALPQMARSFGADPVGLNIGVVAYTLTLAVVIAIGGWMANEDRHDATAAPLRLPSGAAGQWDTDGADHSGLRCADAIDPLRGNSDRPSPAA